MPGVPSRGATSDTLSSVACWRDTYTEREKLTSNAPAVQAGFEALRQEGSSVDEALVTALAQIALTSGAAVSYAGIMAMMYYDATTGKVH